MNEEDVRRIVREEINGVIFCKPGDKPLGSYDVYFPKPKPEPKLTPVDLNALHNDILERVICFTPNGMKRYHAVETLEQIIRDAYKAARKS